MHQTAPRTCRSGGRSRSADLGAWQAPRGTGSSPMEELGSLLLPAGALGERPPRLPPATLRDGGDLPKVPLAEDWCQRVVWHAPQVSSSVGAAGEVSDKALVPHWAGLHPRVSWQGDKMPAVARKATQQRHLWGHSERGWGTSGDGAEHRTDTPPASLPYAPSEASLEHGLPPAPAPLPCIFPKDWYEAPAPSGGGGGAGTQLPGPVVPPLGSRRTEEQVPLWAMTTPSSSAAAQGNGPPLGPAVPSRAGPLPLLASPFF